MIENIEILISYNMLSVQEVFRILSENNTYIFLTFIKNINKNMEMNNGNYILSCDNKKYIDNNLYLKKDDKENLINFFSLFGKSDLSGQLTNCKTHKEIFKKRLNYIEKEEKYECKSTSVLIVGIGFLIIILFF